MEFKDVDVRIKRKYDQPPFNFASNVKIITRNGIDQRTRFNLRIKHAQFSRYPIMYARHYDLWHYVEVSEEDKEYIMGLAVNDVSRLQQAQILKDNARDRSGQD